MLKYQAGDEDALERLVRMSYTLVAHHARRLTARMIKVPYDDVYSEVLIALVEAARRYDPDRGVLFYTLFSSWASGRVYHYVRDLSRIIRLPAKKQEDDKWEEFPDALLASDCANALCDDDVDDHGYVKTGALAKAAVRVWEEDAARSVGDTVEWKVVAAGLECAAIGDSPRYISDAMDIHQGLMVARRVRRDLRRYLHHADCFCDSLHDLGCWPVCRALCSA